MDEKPNLEARPTRTRRLRTGVLVSFATLLVLLVVAEIGVRLFVSKEFLRPAADIYSTSDLEGVGYTLRRDYASTAFRQRLRTNRFGFRGPDWSKQKAEDVFRIAVIGDSHAFGLGVDFAETMGEILARRLRARRPTEVLNFAVTGYNSIQEAAVFHRIVLGFSPDLLVLVPSANDHEPTLWADDDGWLHQGEGEDTQVGNWEDRVFQKLQVPILEHSSLWRLVRVSWYRYRLSQKHVENGTRSSAEQQLLEPMADGPIPEQLQTQVQAPLASILATCKKRCIPVVLAPMATAGEWRKMFHQLGETYGVPVVELLAAFPEANSWAGLLDEFGLGWDPHLDARAHARWAVRLERALDAEGLLKPR